METLCLFIVVCLIVERNICMKKSGKCQSRARGQVHYTYKSIFVMLS